MNISNEYIFIHTQIWFEIKIRYVRSGNWMVKSYFKEKSAGLAFSPTQVDHAHFLLKQPHTVALAGLDSVRVLLSGCPRWKAWGTVPGWNELLRPVGTSGNPHERAWWAWGTACGVCRLSSVRPQCRVPNCCLGESLEGPSAARKGSSKTDSASWTFPDQILTG